MAEKAARADVIRDAPHHPPEGLSEWPDDVRTYEDLAAAIRRCQVSAAEARRLRQPLRPRFDRRRDFRDTEGEGERIREVR